MTDTKDLLNWANWRRRVWRPAAIEAGVTGDLRPYRLRGSFVSLLLWEGRSLTYVAKQAGHSVATLARHYAGTMRELESQPRVPAAEAIRAAREQTKGTHSGRTPKRNAALEAADPEQLRLWHFSGPLSNPDITRKLDAAIAAFEQLHASGLPEPTTPAPIRLHHRALRQAVLAVLESTEDSLRPIEVRLRAEQQLGRAFEPHSVVASLNNGAHDPGVPIVRIGRGRYQYQR